MCDFKNDRAEEYKLNLLTESEQDRVCKLIETKIEDRLLNIPYHNPLYKLSGLKRPRENQYLEFELGITSREKGPQLGFSYRVKQYQGDTRVNAWYKDRSNWYSLVLLGERDGIDSVYSRRLFLEKQDYYSEMLVRKFLLYDLEIDQSSVEDTKFQVDEERSDRLERVIRLKTIPKGRWWRE